MITVIVPVYNAENYLKNCIDSVIGQIFKDWQLFLVNDGSKDASLSICEAFAEKESRIKVFSQENKGQAAARNLALSAVRTPYVTFLDSDDALREDTLEENMAVLSSNNRIECLQYPISHNYGAPNQFTKRYSEEIIESDFIENWLTKKKISWIVCDKIFKSKLFDDLRFKEGIFYEDNLMMSELVQKLNCLYLSDKGLYYYYRRENSTTTGKLSLKNERDSLFVTNSILKLLRNTDHKELALKFYLRVINIRKSLKHNFNFSVPIEKEVKQYFSTRDIAFSNFSVKDKAKLLLTTLGLS